MISRRIPESLRRSKLWEAVPDFRIGFQNLLLHKLRSLLTMLGIIF